MWIIWKARPIRRSSNERLVKCCLYYYEVARNLRRNKTQQTTPYNTAMLPHAEQTKTFPILCYVRPFSGSLSKNLPHNHTKSMVQRTAIGGTIYILRWTISGCVNKMCAVWTISPLYCCGPFLQHARCDSIVKVTQHILTKRPTLAQHIVANERAIHIDANTATPYTKKRALKWFYFISARAPLQCHNMGYMLPFWPYLFHFFYFTLNCWPDLGLEHFRLVIALSSGVIQPFVSTFVLDTEMRTIFAFQSLSNTFFTSNTLKWAYN